MDPVMEAQKNMSFLKPLEVLSSVSFKLRSVSSFQVSV